MRKVKLAALSLACVCALAVTSCNKPEQTPTIDMADVNRDGEFALERMILDTSNTKLNYYIGDEIDLSGLKVKCSYVRYQPQFERIEKDITDFMYDLSTVDMTSVGEKLILIYYRDKTNIASDYVRINVKSSVLETSGLEYAGGLECDVLSKEFLLNSKFEAPIINKLAVHYFTGTNETSVKTIRQRNCKIDSPFNPGDTLTALGDYMYKISYTEELTINGEKVTNTVQTYIIIRVKNDVTKISFAEGNLSFEATANGLDYSSWKINVEREVGGVTKENFDINKYNIMGINPLVVGDYDVTLEHKESGKLCSVKVNIKESTKEVINVLTSFQETMDKTPDENGIKYLDSDHLLFVKNAEKIEAKKATFGNLSFDSRITIKKMQLFGINMSGPGTIIVYIASSGDEVREINFLSSDLSVLNSFYTAGTKQQIGEYVVNVDKAGTYYFQVPSSGYVHGAVVAVSNEV